ncbi:unnamed protein product [Polarella glacialis]|uniref:Ion transport domain-containing protein n=1 Tax=Polarella glacialis TaxID=89957 RepID=A0A813E333_POLGL|nr:unnamed protein product [Polarella glacialis]
MFTWAAIQSTLMLQGMTHQAGSQAAPCCFSASTHWSFLRRRLFPSQMSSGTGGSCWTLKLFLAGALDLAISASGADASSMNLVRFLRVFRMVRLLCIFRKWPLLKELWKLVKMTIACTKMLFWSFVFCFMVMTCWSMAAMELLNPLMIKLWPTRVSSQTVHSAHDPF